MRGNSMMESEGGGGIPFQAEKHASQVSGPLKRSRRSSLMLVHMFAAFPARPL